MTATSHLPDKNSRAVRMEHETADRKNLLMLNWELGNTCNYTCSYCPEQLHDGSRYWPAHEAVLRFADKLVSLTRSRGQTVHIQFTGGEVTLMPRLRSLLQSLHDLGCRLSVISNGSRSISWWRESSRYLDAAVLTFHPETADIEHFENVVQLLSSRIRTHINVAAPPTMFEHALKTAVRLSQSCSDITLLLKPLLIEFGEQLYPYSQEQLEILSTRQFKARLTRPYYDPRGDMVITYDDGTSVQKGPSMFIADGSNNWFGWECDIGMELLSINMWGEIYRGLCGEGGKLGHFSQPELFDLPRTSIICTRDSCRCLLDIMTSRRRLRGDTIASSGL
jgi:organic radical activating enzyme